MGGRPVDVEAALFVIAANVAESHENIHQDGRGSPQCAWVELTIELAGKTRRAFRSIRLTEHVSEAASLVALRWEGRARDRRAASERHSDPVRFAIDPSRGLLAVRAP